MPSSPSPASILRASKRLAALVGLLASGVLALPGHADEGERVSELLTRGGSKITAEHIHPNIWVASGNSNAYLVKTPAGSVVIDTGLAWQAEQTRWALLEAAGDSPVRALVLTHAHEDHVGGAPLWLSAPGSDAIEVIAHRDFLLRQQYFEMLAEYKNRRAAVLWGGVMPDGLGMPDEANGIEVDVLVDDVHRFELGGVEFEVIATPGGEGPDAVSVWVPDYGAVFVGDALGPTAATFPNLFTLRGENIRESIPLLASIDRVRALGPELYLPGHFDPLEGEDAIGEMLDRTSKAIRYVHDATVAGMNQGKSLWQLMREIELPPELAVSQQYGRVPWGVRAIYELHTGWFRFESTTELYDVPPADAYAELGKLAGGANTVALRASELLEGGDPLRALHLVEVALAVDHDNRFALEVQLAALRALAQEDGGNNFQLAGWLRHRIEAVEARIAGESAR